MRTKVAECVNRTDTRRGVRYSVYLRVVGRRVYQALPLGTTLRDAKRAVDVVAAASLHPAPAKAPTLAVSVREWLRDGKVKGLAPSSLSSRRLACAALLRLVGDRPSRRPTGTARW